MEPFFGRDQELKKLKTLKQKNTASLVVIRGRRRIGKSRLIREFGKVSRMIHFSGLPPTPGMSAQKQRDDFAKQIHRELAIPLPRSDDWGDLFWTVAAHTKTNDIIIVIDEISWIGSKDKTFLGKLKNAWDLFFSHNPKLILILCGSVSSWIEKNILSNTGFVGRISLKMILRELPLKDGAQFWYAQQKHIAAYEIFKVLSITGCIPKYLEEILPGESAESNIQRLCFEPEGILFNEFDNIFHDLFSNKSDLYRKIVQRLAQGSASLHEIYKTLGIKPSGACSDYMDDLIQAGFVTRDYTWSISDNQKSSLSKFRLSDNYIRFYLKMIEPLKDQIDQNDFSLNSLSSLPNWPTLFGLQFENLVLHNLTEVYKALNISPSDISRRGPYFQRNTKKIKGCQIDLLIQTRHQTLYLCEIKFSKHPIGLDVIEEVKTKMQNIQTPRGFSLRPVLIHVNGVSETVESKQFFSHIIDFSLLLGQEYQTSSKLAQRAGCFSIEYSNDETAKC